MFEINKTLGDIPGRANRKYPFIEMEVGENFLVECAPELSLKTRQRLVGSANAVMNHHGLKRKFSTRKEEKGIRMYRVK